jgi:hypothetical protein
MGEGRGAYRVSVGRPLERLSRRWEDNIKMDLQEEEWGVWTGSVWLWIGKGVGLL